MVIHHMVTQFNAGTKCCYLSHGLLKPLGVVIYHLVIWFVVATNCCYLSHGVMVYCSPKAFVLVT